jgi:flagellar biosynthesis/type III secretory pathway protein FliH
MERVLKAGEGADPWPRRLVPAQAWQAAARAQAIVAEAGAQAEAIRRQAEADRAAIHQAAARTGHEEGLARAAAALLAAAAKRDAWLVDAEREVVALALEVARRIVGREVRLDPGAVRSLAAEALGAARGRRRVTMRLHPRSAEALRREAGALATAAGLPGVAVVEDPALDPADVVVETEAGQVDARLSARLEAFRQALDGAGP